MIMNGLCQTSALNSVSVNQQTLVANGLINFDTNTVINGCAIQHVAGSNTVLLKPAGLYKVDFNTDITATAAGPLTIQLLANGVEVPGAVANITAVLDTVYHVAFSTIIKVLRTCPLVVENSVSLQIRVSAAATASNSNISVHKL